MDRDEIGQIQRGGVDDGRDGISMGIVFGQGGVMSVSFIGRTDLQFTPGLHFEIGFPSST